MSALRHPVLRAGAGMAALAALATIGLRPSYPADVSPGEALLATPGASSTQLRRWADSLRVERLFSLPGGGAPGGRRAAEIPHAGVVARPETGISVLHVAGWGLDRDDWEDLSGTAVRFLAADPPAGIREASWPATVALGRSLEVSGSVGGLREPAWIRLADVGGPVDSARVAPGDPRFRLTDVPRAAGPARYSLSVSDQPAMGESLGVVVAAPPPPSLLVLEQAPSFETRALRDWQGARGGRIAIRTRTSLDRFRYEHVNGERMDLTRVTPRLLAGFDLVVLDGATLATLTPAERGALREAVAERGLGLLVRADQIVLADAPSLSRTERGFFLGFSSRRQAEEDAPSVRPVWPDRPLAPGGGLPVEGGLDRRFGVADLVTDGRGGGLVQVAPRGSGRIALSVIGETARWIRAGDAALHGSYWSYVVGELARRDRSGGVQTDGPVIVDRPSGLILRPNRDSIVVLQGPSGERDTVYLATDRVDPGESHGTFWPREAGWHRLTDGIGEVGWLHAEPTTAWTSRQAQARLTASARHLAWAGSERAGPPSRTPGRRPIPLVPVFLVLLVAAGYLWAARA